MPQPPRPKQCGESRECAEEIQRLKARLRELEAEAASPLRRIMEIRSQILAESAKRAPDILPAHALPLVADLLESPIAYFHFVAEDRGALWPGNGFSAIPDSDRFPPAGDWTISETDPRAESIREQIPMAWNGDAPPISGTPSPEGASAFRRELLVPVIRHNRPVALLGVADKPTPYTPADRDAAALLADVIWHLVKSKWSETYLRKSELRFRNLFQNHAAATLLIDPKSGAILDANPSAVRFYGWSREELQRKRIQDVNVLSPEAVRREMEKAASRERTYFKFRHRLADGSVRDVEVFSSRVETGEEPVLYSIVHDVTERLDFERSLRETEKKYTALVENAPVGIFTAESAGRVLSMNDAMAGILGFSDPRRPPEGNPPWTELFVDPARRDRFLQRLREDGQAENFVFQARSADGRRPWLSVNARVAGSDGNGGFLVEGFAGDVTDRVETEAALEKRLLALTLPLDDPQGVRFEDLFNPEEIQRLQDEFAAATGVASIITHPDGAPITRPSNFRRLCAEIIRPTEKGAANCRRSNARFGCPNPDGPTIRICKSGGLRDAGAAISVGGKHIANWLVGQVRDGDQAEAKIREYAREIGADEDAAAEAFHEVPAMPPGRFEKIVRVLFTLANQLSAFAYQNIQQARFITERKRAECDRIRMERDYRTLFREMLDGFAVHEIILDDAGRPIDYRFLAVNPAFERLTGLSAETVVGRTVLEALPQTEAHWIETYGRVALTGEPILFDNHSEALDKHFEVAAFRPAPGQFACIFSDITDRKRNEAAMKQLNDALEAKNAELEQVVYVASHDLRSPLVNIDGYSKELGLLLTELREALDGAPDGPAAAKAAEPFLDEEIPEALRFIRTSAAKMDTLLTGLLRLSRSGRAALNIGPRDMNALMAQVVDATEYRIRETGAAVTVDDLPPCRGDAVQLNQIFSNLLDNALKYRSPDREARIRISGETAENRSIYRVEDNGIGMQPDHLEKIFDIFHRLNPDLGEGEGLGLTIVRRILDRMEGTVEVTSTPGAGSRFTVDLPAA
jgi:PAS domain S-box-containing protein